TVTFQRATFAPGSDALTIVVHVDAATTDGTVLSNTGRIASATSDPDPSNNSSTATTTVIVGADLSVTKTATPDPAAPGGTITYIVTVANNGARDAQDVTLTDFLAERLSFVSNSGAPGWTTSNPTSASGGVITSSTPLLAAGSSATFTIVVRVSP